MGVVLMSRWKEAAVLEAWKGCLSSVYWSVASVYVVYHILRKGSSEEEKWQLAHKKLHEERAKGEEGADIRTAL